MKVISLSEAKTRLSHYGRMCRNEPVVVTVNGVPEFELVPLNEDDDLINQLFERRSPAMAAKRFSGNALRTRGSQQLKSNNSIPARFVTLYAQNS